MNLARESYMYQYIASSIHVHVAEFVGKTMSSWRGNSFTCSSWVRYSVTYKLDSKLLIKHCNYCIVSSSTVLRSIIGIVFASIFGVRMLLLLHLEQVIVSTSLSQ